VKGRSVKRHVELVLVLLLFYQTALPSSPRKLLLDIQPAPLAWADSRLQEMMHARLSLNPNFRIQVSHTGDRNLPPFPTDRFNVDSLLDWGTEMGGHYLLVVTIDREFLERRKSFSLPLVFHKYEVVGVITGEFRFLDLQKRRLLGAEPFRIELTGSQQIQAEMDDNRQDPALHLSAPEKARLFRALEDKLTGELAKRVTVFTRGR